MSASIADTISVIVTHVRVKAGAEAAFSAWHARFTDAVGGFPGFLSAEIAPPSLPENDWRLMVCFQNSQRAQEWRDSPARARLWEEANALIEGSPRRDIYDEEAPAAYLQANVTEAITTTVKPGKEVDYRQWLSQIQEAQARFPGYQGQQVQSPSAEKPRCWTTLLRFDTPAHLDSWLNSPERAALVRAAEPLIESTSKNRIIPLGWFPTAGAPVHSVWKETMMVELTLFPMVILELHYLNAHLSSLPPSLATFFSTSLTVAGVSYIGMPLAFATLGWWLLPKQESPKWLNAAGYLLVTALYAAEVVLLSYL